MKDKPSVCQSIIAGPYLLQPSDSAISSGANRPDLLWQCTLTHINCAHSTVFSGVLIVCLFFYIPCLHFLSAVFTDASHFSPSTLLQYCIFPHSGTNIEISYHSQSQSSSFRFWPPGERFLAAFNWTVSKKLDIEDSSPNKHVLIPHIIFWPLGGQVTPHGVGGWDFTRGIGASSQQGHCQQLLWVEVMTRFADDGMLLARRRPWQSDLKQSWELAAAAEPQTACHTPSTGGRAAQTREEI